MRPAFRIAIFAATLLIVFGIAFTLGSLLVPESIVETWSPRTTH